MNGFGGPHSACPDRPGLAFHNTTTNITARVLKLPTVLERLERHPFAHWTARVHFAIQAVDQMAKGPRHPKQNLQVRRLTRKSGFAQLT